MGTVGRPSIEWTPELVLQIEELIISGMTIDQVGAKPQFPSATSIWRRYGSNAEFGSIITRAMELRTEREIDALVALADTADAETANAIKLKVWTRMWVAGKRKPRKYGERIAQDVNVSGAIQILSTIPRPAQIEDGKTIDAEIDPAE